VEYLISVNGNTVGSRDRFASVPFALNAGGAAINYSPSTNISTTGNILDLTDKLASTVTVGSNQLPNSKVPMFSADQKGRIVYAGEYPANIGGDIAGKLDSQYVMKLRGVPLSTVLPTNGQVLQFNGTNWAPNLLSGSGPWSYNAGIIYPANNSASDKVAIGSSTATSLLDVKNTSLSSFSSAPVASFINSNASLNPGSGVVHISHQAGNGAALYIQNMNSGIGADGINVQISSGANTSDGIRVNHSGSGRAGNFLNTNSTSTVETLYASANAAVPAIKGANLLGASSNSLAIGIHGKTPNPHPNAAGVYGENNGGGSGVIGTTSANVGAVLGVNFGAGNLSNASGVYGLSNSSSTLSGGVYGEHKLAGSGVYGINSYSNLIASGVSGVYGTVINTSNVNSGVFGEVGGAANGVKGISQSGNSIYGLKPGTFTGIAGKFENQNPNNSSEALLATTNASVAAIRAISSGPGATLALHVDNGHIKSTSTTAPSFTPGTISGFLTPVYGTNFVGGTDVKGVVSVTFSHTTGTIGNGYFFDFGANFNKPYSSIPIVVVAPTTDLNGLSFRVQSVSTTGFMIRVFKSQNSGVTDPNTLPSGNSYTFNYFVIE